MCKKSHIRNNVTNQFVLKFEKNIIETGLQ